MISTPVFVEPSDALPIVSVAVTFRSGAACDPAGRDGLARVVARMLRRGARGYTAQQIEEAIDTLGAELAADVAGSALTLHFEVIRRNLDPMVDLVATLLAHPTFDEKELSRLLRESEAELIEARDDDRTLASRAFRRTLFAGHPYGRRVSGQIGTLRTIGEGDVRAFYARHLCRANAIVIVSGDASDDEGRSVAERLLAGLPEGERVPDPVPPPTAVPGRIIVFVDRPERTQTQMVLGGLGTDAHDPDHVALFVANTAFGGTFTSRLMQEIRAKRGWSYGASSRVGFDRQRDSFTMWTAPAATDAAACLALEIELFEASSAPKRALTADAARNFVVSANPGPLPTLASTSTPPASASTRSSRPSSSPCSPGYHDRYVENIQAVDRPAANTAVRQRLSADDHGDRRRRHPRRDRRGHRQGHPAAGERDGGAVRSGVRVRSRPAPR